MLKAVATAAALGLVVSGCGSQARSACRIDRPGPTAGSTAQPLVEGTTAPGYFRVVVDGSERFQYETPSIDLRILISGQRPDVPVEIRHLSVGILAPVEVQKQQRFRTAFDLLGYTGDGEYCFGPGADPTTSAGVGLPEDIRSGAFVEMFDFSTQQIRTLFNRVTQPCSVILSNRARTGKLTCPALGAEMGEGSISLEMEWRAT